MREARRFLPQLLMLLCLVCLYAHSKPAHADTAVDASESVQDADPAQTWDEDWKKLAEWKDMPPLYNRMPLPVSLVGKKLLLVWNGKHNSDRLLRCFASCLRRTLPEVVLLPAGTTVFFSPIAKGMKEARAAVDEMRGLKPDLVVLATGDCRVCAAWLAVESILLEKAGIPTVAVVTRPFYKTYENVCRNMRMQTLNCIALRHPVAAISQEKVDEKAREFFEEFCKLFPSLAVHSGAAAVNKDAAYPTSPAPAEENTP